MDWTKRVQELHQLAHDHYDHEACGDPDWPTKEAHVEGLLEWITQSQNVTPEEGACVFDEGPVTLDADDIRVIRNELERIVGTA